MRGLPGPPAPGVRVAYQKPTRPPASRPTTPPSKVAQPRSPDAPMAAPPIAPTKQPTMAATVTRRAARVIGPVGGGGVGGFSRRRGSVERMTASWLGAILIGY